MLLAAGCKTAAAQSAPAAQTRQRGHSHLALLSKRLHTQQHKAERQALQHTRGIEISSTSSPGCLDVLPSGLRGVNERPKAASVAIRWLVAAVANAGKLQAGPVPAAVCQCTPNTKQGIIDGGRRTPIPVPPLTIRVMPTITPDTPKMKPASPASCATSMEAWGCTAARRWAFGLGRTGRNWRLAAGLLRHVRGNAPGRGPPGGARARCRWCGSMGLLQAVGPPRPALGRPGGPVSSPDDASLLPGASHGAGGHHGASSGASNGRHLRALEQATGCQE